MVPSIGAWLIQLISWMFVFGLLFYAMNNKGWMNGLMAGIIYAVVFLVVYILFSGMLFALPISGQHLPFFSFTSWAEMFAWPGVWLQLLAFLLFSAFIGFANEHK
jgi:hypothetical protein